MKIRFDFSEHRHSLYSELLADYMHRLSEFAKLGAVKGDVLEICFVFGAFSDSDTVRGVGRSGGYAKNDYPPSPRFRQGNSSHSPRAVSSEELSELIQKNLSAGISNLLIKVQSMDEYRAEISKIQPTEKTKRSEKTELSEGSKSLDRIQPTERKLYLSLISCNIGTDFAEVLAAEQIYRVFMIMHNRKYHK